MKELNDLVQAIESISDAITDDLGAAPTNDFGFTAGDELHFISNDLTRIANSLELLVKHFVDNK